MNHTWYIGHIKVTPYKRMGIKRKTYFAGAETVLLCKVKYKDISLQARKIDNLCGYVVYTL